jgi:hypothetical protein
MNERFHRRIAQIDEMNRLAETVLPAKASGDDRYPVQDDHCFKRIAYDAVVGDRWDRVVRRPFYRHASDEQIAGVVRVLREMRDAPGRAVDLNRRSRAYRR